MNYSLRFDDTPVDQALSRAYTSDSAFDWVFSIGVNGNGYYMWGRLGIGAGLKQYMLNVETLEEAKAVATALWRICDEKLIRAAN